MEDLTNFLQFFEGEYKVETVSATVEQIEVLNEKIKQQIKVHNKQNDLEIVYMLDDFNDFIKDVKTKVEIKNSQLLVGKQGVFYEQALQASKAQIIGNYKVLVEKEWVTCKFIEGKEEPNENLGWKLHISVGYQDLSLAINFLLSQKEFSYFKFIHASELQKIKNNQEQASKPITIYLFYDVNKSISEIAQSINLITLRFKEMNIKPHEQHTITDRMIKNDPYFSIRFDLACGLFRYIKNKNEPELVAFVDSLNVKKVLASLKEEELTNEYRLIPGYARFTSFAQQEPPFKIDVMFTDSQLYFHSKTVILKDNSPSGLFYAPGGCFPLKQAEQKAEIFPVTSEEWSNLLFPKGEDEYMLSNFGFQTYSLVELEKAISPSAANISSTATIIAMQKWDVSGMLDVAYNLLINKQQLPVSNDDIAISVSATTKAHGSSENQQNIQNASVEIEQTQHTLNINSKKDKGGGGCCNIL